MQPDEIATAVVLALQTAIAPVRARLTAVEGELKTLGELRERVAGLPPAAVPVDLAPVLARLATADAHIATLMEPKVTPIVVVADEIDDADLAASLTGLLRKELAGLEPAPRIQRRVIRDGAGRVERVVDEPIA